MPNNERGNSGNFANDRERAAEAGKRGWLAQPRRRLILTLVDPNLGETGVSRTLILARR